MQTRHRFLPLAASLVLTLALAACHIRSVEPSVFAWEGELRPPAFEPDAIRGTAAALSQGRRTQASISVGGGEPGAVYRWRIRRGTCRSPGSIVGGLAAYPDLEPGPQGGAVADAILSEPMPAGTSYHAVVLSAAEEAQLACGDLRPV